MDKTLYDLMDWAGIEEIVYSEAANPHRMLGAHMTPEGMLVQAFIPTARDITVKLSATGKQYQMEMADETGFFAALIPRKTLADYTLLVFYDNGTLSEIHDPYSFAPQFTESDLKKFEAGVHYSIYNKMGAHPMTVKGVSGVYFAVWAPEAMRVSVVGDFNLWDGRRSQMRRLGDSGVFEIFIPELKKGAVYKYEIKFKNGDPALKADPYANYAELRPNTASIVWDLDEYKWNDQDWMKKRAALDTKTAPMSIYEVHLGSWMRKPTEVDKRGREIVGSEFYNYREIAVKLAEYVKEMGYTHVELLPVMEHPLDASWGYQVTGYYAPTSRFGTPDDFMYFMDYLHGQGIGVILDWVPAHFPRDAWGMAQFDGSCLYEHKDPRQGAHPHWGTLIYNYGRPGVSNFLIANAMFWADRYHADGIRFDAVASMLYLDYGKNPGEWIANMYGGHENLEAVEFLKHLNSVFRGRKDGAILIAEESTAWPKVTGDVKNGGLGFDYKWNMGWMNDFLGYMEQDPYFRCHHYNELTFSMIYAYSENFVLVFSHDEVVHGIPSKHRYLNEGDIVSLDTGVIWKGYQSDAARTHMIGEVTPQARKLVEVTQQSFFEGIKFAKAGNHLNDISKAIQAYAESFGFGVVRDLVGHGIGTEMHEEPEIPNFAQRRKGIRLAAGMTLAIEPMITAGRYDVAWMDDGWTVVTEDGSLASHYENTILITDGEPEILSL